MKKNSFTIKSALKFLARADIFFFALIWLMVLLFIGTLSQKYIGLYVAQEKYLSSFIIWIMGIVPLPGGMMALAFVFLGLCSKLTLGSWKREQAGTFIIHLGVTLLLLGGFITSQLSYEGNIVLAEGESSSYISDYYETELVFSDGQGREIIFSEKELYPDNILDNPDLGFSLKIINHCQNCGLSERENPAENNDLQGLLIRFNLDSLPLEKEKEKNVSGLILDVSGSEEDNGRYGVFEYMPVMQRIEGYAVELRHKQTELPFKISLLNFKKELHPGTSKAKSYSSEVILEENKTQWHSMIEMNSPLRYKGYTFFQSSYIEENGRQMSVLAVVKNVGRLFPYISSILICIGLLVHLAQRLPKGRRRK